MPDIKHILPLFVLLFAAIAAVGVNAAGPWDGEYRGEGEFDGYNKCLPKTFEAIGIIKNDSLTITIKEKRKTVKTFKLKVSADGRIPRLLICCAQNTSGYAQGRVSNTEIRLTAQTYDMQRRAAQHQSGEGTITMSRTR